VHLSEPAPPIPSATVVPLRDRSGGGLEVLMVERAAALAYGGMWAFPGGRVDPADADPARPGDELAAARRTAVREASEEVGLAFPPDALAPFSHWTGGAAQAQRYAAWYFVAPAPAGTVVLDGRETLDHRWLAPAEALAARDRGELDVVAPTWVTLHALAAVKSVEDVMTLAQARDPIVYLSRMAVTESARIALWHGDAGYASGDPHLPGPRHRLTMTDRDWTFERY
jgi:8-oxo-dGTP pyrophosphatase MutT (NUDIX family)